MCTRACVKYSPKYELNPTLKISRYETTNGIKLMRIRIKFNRTRDFRIGNAKSETRSKFERVYNSYDEISEKKYDFLWNFFVIKL